MSLLTALAVGLGLAADAFAASVSRGCLVRERVGMYALLMAVLFGGFQALMPWIGWQAGAPAQEVIRAWDHWVAFVILFAIGAKSIHEGMRGQDGDEAEERPRNRQLTLAALVVTAIATSIDALAAGFGFALVTTDMWLMIAVTGAVTFALSWAGVHLGCRISGLVGQRVEIVGGAILILIGANILYRHLSV